MPSRMTNLVAWQPQHTKTPPFRAASAYETSSLPTPHGPFFHLPPPPPQPPPPALHSISHYLARASTQQKAPCLSAFTVPFRWQQWCGQGGDQGPNIKGSYGVCRLQVRGINNIESIQSIRRSLYTCQRDAASHSIVRGTGEWYVGLGRGTQNRSAALGGATSHMAVASCHARGMRTAIETSQLHRPLHAPLPMLPFHFLFEFLPSPLYPTHPSNMYTQAYPPCPHWPQHSLPLPRQHDNTLWLVQTWRSFWHQRCVGRTPCSG